MESPIQVMKFKDTVLQREKVRLIFNIDECPTVFGDSISITGSQLSRGSSRLVDAKADLAVRSTKSEAAQAKLKEMEVNWKRKQAELHSKLKNWEADVLHRMEAERLKLQWMDAERDVRTAAAKAN